MTPKEILEQKKAQYDEAIYLALSHLNTPGMDALQTVSDVVTIAYTYKAALIAVAAESSMELAEHYAELAEQAVPKAQFLMGSILFYRGRQGIAP